MGEGRKKRSLAPARTAEARESQLINLAMNRAQEMLENGTASSQIITHFLNLGTEKARLDRLKLEADVELARAKANAMESQMRFEEVAEKALQAFKTYAGIMSEDEEDDYDD